MVNLDQELDRISGNHIALELAFISLCRELADAGLGVHVDRALAYTENILEAAAIKLNKDASANHTLHAFAVAQNMRASVFDAGQVPRRDK